MTNEFHRREIRYRDMIILGLTRITQFRLWPAQNYITSSCKRFVVNTNATISIKMQATTLFIATLFAGAMGSPLNVDSDSTAHRLQARDPVPVGFGQQIQTSNEANYWVVWVEGDSACPNIQSLDPLTDNPCDITFRLPGGTEKLKLGDCDGNNMPHSLYLDSGSFVRTCTADSDKINCHHGEHDIVKHGKCVA
ncbi:hypothetical protein F4859DRAFT_489376 [Xylaria cf. heliscus]|nr:hypothetical protein F4859DRAFT_489376 [Xylaria cf. heliscus]